MPIAPTSSLFLSSGTVRTVRAPARLAKAGLASLSAMMSTTWTTCLVSATRPRPVLGPGRNTGWSRRCSAYAGGALCSAAMRKPSPSRMHKFPNPASQMRVAFASIASNTGSSSPGDLLMTCSTSEVAVCCSSASLRSSRALLQLVEHPCVFDRDDGLAGEIADQCDLIIAERSNLLAIDADHTDQRALFEHGHRHDCSVTAEFGAGNRKRVTLAVGLAIHAFEHLHESFRSRSVDNGGARSGTQ